MIRWQNIGDDVARIKFSFPCDLEIDHKSDDGMWSSSVSLWAGNLGSHVNEMQSLTNDTRFSVLWLAITYCQRIDLIVAQAVVCANVEPRWLDMICEFLEQSEGWLFHADSVAIACIQARRYDLLARQYRMRGEPQAALITLERGKLWQEYLDLLQKIGPDCYVENFDEKRQPKPWPSVAARRAAYEAKLGQVQAMIQMLDIPKTPQLDSGDILEDKYLYGEISKEEYERLKAKAAPASAKICAGCGKPVNPEDAYCRHCGAKASP